MKGASSWGGAASEISGIGVPPLTEAKAAPEPANRNPVVPARQARRYRHFFQRDTPLRKYSLFYFFPFLSLVFYEYHNQLFLSSSPPLIAPLIHSPSFFFLSSFPLRGASESAQVLSLSKITQTFESFCLCWDLKSDLRVFGFIPVCARFQI